ncbi:nitroreductase [bacterium]|nr:MAG: nitroreductase [bacterium]
MNDSPLLELLLSRRSAAALTEPAPSRETLDRILGAAGTVPDHGLLRPFRFVVAEGEGRARFGDALAKAAAEHMPGMSPSKLDKVRAKAYRSPTLVALVASPRPGKIEVWEQDATAACAGYAVVLAAYALGVGAVWKSVPFVRAAALTEALALTPQEWLLGFIHLGTPAREQEPAARAPLALAERTMELCATGLKPWSAP